MTNAKSCLEAAQVTCPPSLPLECGTHCDFNLNIGIFFDGTDNNMDRDTPTLSQSNVARLFLAYKDAPLEGFFRHYIEGVATPSPKKFGTDGEDSREAAAGKGGEPRIIWGLLEVLNSVHRFVSKLPMFDGDQMMALCTDHRVTPDNSNEWPRPTPPKEDAILTALGLESGLVDNEKTRIKFLKECASKLSRQLKTPETLPRIAGIYLDVFGFSRGSTQARVFTTWLHEVFLIGGKLFGIPSYVRMLGIMDTVASVGITNANASEGHWSWATPENLRIHPAVKNCVHYAALHEYRTVFPLDSVCQDSVLPANCHEHYYPGAHSDVGGGYWPGSQGKAVRLSYDTSGKTLPETDDSKKLSQLALNDMYQAARKTCEFHSEGQAWLEVTPQSKDDQNPLITQFALDPQVRSSVEGYFASCGISQALPIDGQLRQHGLLYLAWRYQVTQANYFEQLDSVKYARIVGTISETDSKGKVHVHDSLHYYRKGQEVFARQIDLMSRLIPTFGQDREARNRYNDNVAEIYTLIKSKPVPPKIGAFYDDLVHDSYAAFIEKLGSEFFRVTVEGEGYLRYRAVYRGNQKRVNSMHSAPEARRA